MQVHPGSAFRIQKCCLCTPLLTLTCCVKIESLERLWGCALLESDGGLDWQRQWVAAAITFIHRSCPRSENKQHPVPVLSLSLPSKLTCSFAISRIRSLVAQTKPKRALVVCGVPCQFAAGHGWWGNLHMHTSGNGEGTWELVVRMQELDYGGSALGCNIG